MLFELIFKLNYINNKLNAFTMLKMQCYTMLDKHKLFKRRGDTTIPENGALTSDTYVWKKSVTIPASRSDHLKYDLRTTKNTYIYVQKYIVMSLSKIWIRFIFSRTLLSAPVIPNFLMTIYSCFIFSRVLSAPVSTLNHL